ncbi:hypothetical protein SUGI_0723010, partial [Cryptomeria japonica]
MVDGQAWNGSVSLFKERAFFMKWSGPWPIFRRVRNWCNEHWGEDVTLKTLPNAFYLVICSSTKDKEWIFNSGTFLMGSKGFFIKDWILNLTQKKESITEVSRWIRLYNLPHEYWDVETLRMIGNKL